jgi:hypothetical protein
VSLSTTNQRVNRAQRIATCRDMSGKKLSPMTQPIGHTGFTERSKPATTRARERSRVALPIESACSTRPYALHCNHVANSQRSTFVVVLLYAHGAQGSPWPFTSTTHRDHFFHLVHSMTARPRGCGDLVAAAGQVTKATGTSQEM